MAKQAKESQQQGMEVAQVSAVVKRALERQLNTTATVGDVKLTAKGNSLKITLAVTVDDVRMQLLPLEEKPEAQDDLPMTDA